MYRPVIDDDECTNCRACERICPKGVFDPKESDVTVADPFRCTGCESCSVVCPAAAIRIEET